MIITMSNEFKFRTSDGDFKFNALSLYERTFEYANESGKSNYFNVAFFLTDKKDIVMTVGKVRNMEPLFKEDGVFASPFVIKVLTQKDIDIASRLNILGLKIDVSGKTFLERLVDKLDDYISVDCWIRPLSGPKGMAGIYKMKPFLEMLSNAKVGEKHQDLISDALSYLESEQTLANYMDFG